MHCSPDFIHSTSKNKVVDRNNMSDLQTRTISKSYSEGIHSIKELEKENHISSDDSKLLIEMLSFLYVSARLNNILDNFSNRVEKKLFTSLDKMGERWWSYNGE